jgi:hypothetical protein
MLQEISGTQPSLLTYPSLWIETRDGDRSGLVMFRRHYSRYVYADGRQPKLFVGPGFKLVLITPAADALFVWRKSIQADGQDGLNCSVFRNEGKTLASDLIREADDIAFERWPGMRHFTYVNPAKIRHTRQPGRCFLKAGWRYVRDDSGRIMRTKRRNLIILERPAA